MDAAERVRAVREEIQAPVSPTLENRLAEMVRQAEQAARVKALEEAAVAAESEDMWQPTARLIAAAVRALKET